VNGALLAQRGFTGNPSVFDPAYAFWRGFAAESCNWPFLTQGLAERWYVAETAMKPYPVGHPITFPVQLLSQIVAEHGLRMEDIDRVVVRVSPTATNAHLAEGGMPRNRISAPFSLRYALAMAASGVPAGPAWHLPEHLEDPRAAAFTTRIEIERVEEWGAVIVRQIQADGAFREIPTEVVVEAGGRRFSASARYAKGDPFTDESAMSDAEIARKFRAFTEDTLGPERAGRAIDAALRLETLPDLDPLVRDLHTAAEETAASR
jgi:2-methylcitrate dehydratase PrpD